MRGSSCLLVTLLLSFAAAGCGGDSATPREYCEVLVERNCELAFECWTEAMRRERGFPATREICETNGKEEAMCVGRTADNICATNRTYDGENAATCIDDFNALTCASFGGAATPACGSVCPLDEG